MRSLPGGRQKGGAAFHVGCLENERTNEHNVQRISIHLKFVGYTIYCYSLQLSIFMPKYNRKFKYMRWGKNWLDEKESG